MKALDVSKSLTQIFEFLLSTFYSVDIILFQHKSELQDDQHSEEVHGRTRSPVGWNEEQDD